jgi:hypothetical protein
VRARAPRRGPVLRAAVVLTAVAVGIAILPSGPAAAEDWRKVLERAASSAREATYDAEALLLTLDGDRPAIARVRVSRRAGEGLVVGGDDEPILRLGSDGGGLVSADGGVVPLPAIDFGDRDDFARLERKYAVRVSGVDRLMDRPCTTLEVRRRSDGALRERLWIDEASGLLVRRETYEGGEEPTRLAAYLSLDLDPPTGRMSRDERPSRAVEPPEGRGAAATPVGDEELAVLEEAGFVAPGELPGGFEAIGAYAVDAGSSQPLQLVYGDGLYVVSVFQQPGTPDWSSLPAGAERVAGLAEPVWEWPGASPQRLLWEADGRTWSLVGDAPTGELLALAAALPQDAPGIVERLRRGLGRLLSWVTP